jgi:hypothetical protein
MLAVVILLMGLVAALDRAAGLPTIEEAVTFFGYTAAEIEKVKAGDIVSKDLKEGSDKELAAVVLFTVAKPLAEVARLALEGEMLEIDRTIQAHQVWAPSVPAGEAFAQLAYTEADAKEVAALLKVRAGSQFNFSAEEIARLQAARKQFKKPKGTDPATRDAMSAAVREILAARYEAYRKGGLGAIAPYARGGRKVASPAEELALAIRESLPSDRFPEGYPAVANYPHDGSDDLDHRFFWYKQTVEGRPTFILAHRMLYRTDNEAILVDRQYYVGSSYNSMLVAAGCFAVDDRTAVFYANRTYTDQVAGMGSGLKHGIGRKQMIGEIKAWFKKVKKELGE